VAWSVVIAIVLALMIQHLVFSVPCCIARCTLSKMREWILAILAPEVIFLRAIGQLADAVLDLFKWPGPL
jgi:hypothetical protein